MGGSWHKLWFRRNGPAWVCAVSAAALIAFPAAADPLRLLPLGDSITWGWGSESTYGYRGYLDGLLTDAGVDFEFVGSITDEITINASRFIDPPVRELVGSDPHYGIPGASADLLGQQNKGSLLWSIRNDQDGDGSADSAFANAGGLIPTLVANNQAPDAVLLHIGTNDMGFGDLATTPNPGVYNDDAADSQLFRLLSGLGNDLAAEGLLDGGSDDTRILLARIIPRPVDSRQKPRGAFGTDGIDDEVLENTIAYNDAIDAVVAALPADLRDAISIVDMWDVDLTAPALLPNPFRDDTEADQPFDLFTGSTAAFNEENQTVGGSPVDEASLSGPDYADWLLRYDEESQTFYDAAVADNDFRWNQGLFGLKVGNEYYDAIHPNARGYELMAHLWFAGLFNSGTTNFIPEPGLAVIAALAGPVVMRRRRDA